MCSKPSSQAIATAGTVKASSSILYNSNPSARRSNRRYLVFCGFLLTLLVGSSLLRASSSIPPFNPGVAFVGQRSLGARVALLQAAKVLQEFSPVQSGSVNIKRDGALRCNRSHFRTDVCVARGDVRVVGGGGLQDSGRRRYQVVVLTDTGREQVELLRPYTRKWEESVMKTIDEVQIVRKLIRTRPCRSCGSAEGRAINARNFSRGAQSGTEANNKSLKNGVNDQKESGSRQDEQTGNQDGARIQRLKHVKPMWRSRTDPSSESDLSHFLNSGVRGCEVQHEVPGILFSTGGYTGNVYHEFNDGLIPLFITTRQYDSSGQVVLIVLEYHSWWMSKYAEVVAQITNYTVVDLAHDERVHCFPEVSVGLQIHGELCIDADNEQAAASMKSFELMLQAAYGNRRNKATEPAAERPKLVIMSRRAGSRVLVNEADVVRIAREIGFAVQVLSPTPSSRMVDLYEVLSGCDAMLGVHGAAMTHLLFMRPGATFIQVVPLGTAWAASTYYGEPAQKLGLHYVAYKITPEESSLWGRYPSYDPVLQDPDSVSRQGGWWETKRIYLQAQNVTVSLARMAATLLSAYHRATASA